MTGGDRPGWARRMAGERQARNWSQADAVRAMRLHADRELPGPDSLLRLWQEWESGTCEPDDFCKTVIAAVFGTVTRAMFPPATRRDPQGELLAVAGLDTLELAGRLQRCDLGGATLDGLRIVADRLCSDYAFRPAGQLLAEGLAWLQRVTGAAGEGVTRAQHRELLAAAGWITLLTGCVEYDLGRAQAAEANRQAALSLGAEAGHAGIQAWAHEMRAWMALTTGDYPGVIAAARQGRDTAPASGVAVQLAAQEAKALARTGDRRQAEVALERGRRLLESLPCPDNLDHHFVVDPAKFDFYAMDCYRHLGDDAVAGNLAREVISAATGTDGRERAPMRMAEAHVTLGVVAARQGDLELAVEEGTRALGGDRTSLPSLLMVSRDLTRVLTTRYAAEPATAAYLEQLRSATRPAPESQPAARQ